MLLIATNSSQRVQKLWNYCNVLRDDGISYGDYVEQLTYLLFLKMNHEQHQLADALGSKDSNLNIPEKYDWQSLVGRDGDDLEGHYRDILRELGKKKGLLQTIFQKAQNKIQDPAKLQRLIELIHNEMWIGLKVDVKGEIYEGLLEKNAQDIKSGAGQYFTPRSLIQAIVEVIQPQPGQTICDPACGTGGFLLVAHQYIQERYNRGDEELSRDQLEFLKTKAFHGWEIVDSTARLCVMNLYLHGIGTENKGSPIRVKDSLVSGPVNASDHFDLVLTNPPFGKKSSTTFTNSSGEVKRESGVVNREDFWATTSNKQLNFIQHVKSILKVSGKAAVVIPDNVLFEGGAGEIIRRHLLHDYEVHTMLRLPTGIFYAQGVKANVLFFDRWKSEEDTTDAPSTYELWIYDMRTNLNFTLKQNPLRYENAELQEFIHLFNPDNRNLREETWSEDNPTGRWRRFTYDELITRDKTNLDIFWLRDKSLEDNGGPSDPSIIAIEIIEDLQEALDQFHQIAEDLGIDVP
jgi:type I restriction enzyme M protein